MRLLFVIACRVYRPYLHVSQTNPRLLARVNPELRVQAPSHWFKQPIDAMLDVFQIERLRCISMYIGGQIPAAIWHAVACCTG